MTVLTTIQKLMNMRHYLSRLEEVVRKHWDDKALANFNGESFTFGEMAAEVAKFHVLFGSMGIRKGDKVALCARNSARWAVCFLAANTYEAVVVPILADFHPESINSLVDHSESRLLFTDTDLWKKLDAAKMPLLETAVSVNDFSLLYSRSGDAEAAFAGLDQAFSGKYPGGFSPQDVSYPVGNDKDIALINYTSGTTSAPKGVMIRYDSLSSNIEFGLDNMPCSPGENIVSMLPMAHMYGMVFEFLYPICGGVTINYLGKTPTPALLLGAMAALKPYLVITVPLVMEKIFKSSVQPVLKKPLVKVMTHIPLLNRIIYRKIHDRLMSAFGGQVRCLIMGGAALNPEVEAWFKKFRLPFTVGYGMTEGAPLFGYAPWDEFVPHSCGRKVDRIEVRIDSVDPVNVVGEIQVKGTNVMEGYYKNPEASAAAFTSDGWLRTGDLGVIDRAGNIFIRGRSKNMILSSNGQNIYPEELEAVLNNQPYVVESVVVDRGTRLVGLVYLDREKMEKDGIAGDAVDEYLKPVLAAVNKDLPSYSKIARLEVMDRPFEKTPKMSIRRFLYK